MPPVRKDLNHKTMSTAAAEMIRERILSGKLPPGFQLKQDVLAAECGVSRIPIREALVQLESEGIVKILPHRGAIVVELSAKEIEELYHMRALLEPFLFERSAPLLTAADYKNLNKILSRYIESINKQESARWNELNAEFHMMLYNHADSPRVMRTVHKLLKECDRHTRFQLYHIVGDQELAIREHAELLQLCQAGKYTEGAALLWRHIDHVRVVLVDLLNRSNEPAMGEQTA